MRAYCRVILKSGPETYSAEELEALKACLSEAPGIKVTAEPQQHPRGGYYFGVEREDGSSFDPMAEYLVGRGYLPAI